MDITRGEFDEVGLRSYSRSSRSGTRSSCRSETFSSMEILPPEEDVEHLFMSEELTDEDLSDNETTSTTSRFSQMTFSEVSEQENLSKDGKTDENDQSLEETEKDSTNSRCSSRSEHSLFHDIDDPELKKAIARMRKYDRILSKKMNREKEVKRQRLLFQKQMLEEFSVAPSEKNEVTANTNKYLALMPPSAQLEELLQQIEKEDFTPIFPTQYNYEHHSKSDHDVSKSPSTGSSENAESEKSSSEKGTSNSSPSKKGKTNFIKRNIELAKDAGSYVSMTDDEKKRLNELLGDLDNLDLSSSENEGNAFTNVAIMAGEGYTPDGTEMQRLLEIDEKIQALLPASEFEMISGTPHLPDTHEDPDMLKIGEKISNEKCNEDSGERLKEIQEKLEKLDEEWQDLYETGSPRLTSQQLHRLLDECSLASSRMSSELSYSVLSNSIRSTPCSRQSTARSRASDFTDVTLTDEAGDGEESVVSVDVQQRPVTPLPRETLDKLLSEARACLGLTSRQSENGAEGETDEDDEFSFPSVSESRNSPLFKAVNRDKALSNKHNSDIDVEEIHVGSSEETI